jgi:integrase
LICVVGISVRLVKRCPIIAITYAARHTWATMAYHCEIHPGIISEAMGHSSITVTETYLKPFSNRKIDEANQRVISFVRSGACTV